jgi:predicted nucleic acid-binding protein
MRYLLDTNILSQQENSPKIRNWVLQHYLTSCVCTLSLAELAQGIEALPPGPRRAKFEAAWQDLLEEYEVLGFGAKEAREWGRYVKSAGRPVPVVDSLIAATALANGLAVATVNEKDFPGVSTVNPSI